MCTDCGSRFQAFQVSTKLSTWSIRLASTKFFHQPRWVSLEPTKRTAILCSNSDAEILSASWFSIFNQVWIKSTNATCCQVTDWAGTAIWKSTKNVATAKRTEMVFAWENQSILAITWIAEDPKGAHQIHHLAELASSMSSEVQTNPMDGICKFVQNQLLIPVWSCFSPKWDFLQSPVASKKTLDLTRFNCKMLELMTKCINHAAIEITNGQRECEWSFHRKCSIWPKVQIAPMCIHALEEERYCLGSQSYQPWDITGWWWLSGFRFPHPKTELDLRTDPALSWDWVANQRENDGKPPKSVQICPVAWCGRPTPQPLQPLNVHWTCLGPVIHATRRMLHDAEWISLPEMKLRHPK